MEFNLCLQAMEGRSVGGGDVGFQQRANRRGRAYVCQWCQREKGQRYINTKARIENHILVSHLKTSQIPYLCPLCHYKCLTAKGLMEHYKSKRHTDTMKREEITDCTKFLIKNGTPYVFGDKDYVKLEQNESRTTFAKRGEKASESRKRLPLDIERCFDSGFFNNTVSPVKGNADDDVDTGARVVKDVEARATGIQMDLRDVMSSNFRVAEGTLAAIDSFMGNGAREEVAIGSTEVEDSGEGSSGGRKQKRTSEGG